MPRKKNTRKKKTTTNRTMNLATLWLKEQKTFNDHGFDKAFHKLFEAGHGDEVYNQAQKMKDPVDAADFVEEVADRVTKRFFGGTKPDGEEVFFCAELFAIPVGGLVPSLDELVKGEMFVQLVKSVRGTGYAHHFSNVMVYPYVLHPYVVAQMSLQDVWSVVSEGAKNLMSAKSEMDWSELTSRVDEILRSPSQEEDHVLGTRFLMGLRIVDLNMLEALDTYEVNDLLEELKVFKMQNAFDVDFGEDIDCDVEDLCSGDEKESFDVDDFEAIEREDLPYDALTLDDYVLEKIMDCRLESDEDAVLEWANFVRDEFLDNWRGIDFSCGKKPKFWVRPPVKWKDLPFELCDEIFHQALTVCDVSFEDVREIHVCEEDEDFYCVARSEKGDLVPLVIPSELMMSFDGLWIENMISENDKIKILPVENKSELPHHRILN